MYERFWDVNMFSYAWRKLFVDGPLSSSTSKSGEKYLKQVIVTK